MVIDELRTVVRSIDDDDIRFDPKKARDMVRRASSVLCRTGWLATVT
jgi:hypothetical protein